jgi:hypothetical protein
VNVARRLLFGWLVLLMWANGCRAAPIDEVRSAYRAALAAASAPEAALAVVEAYLRTHPHDAPALAYKGSLKTMQARDAAIPWKKMRLLGEGFELLDRAYARSGGDRLEILMVGGITNASVPKTFGRRGLAERDLRQAIASPGFLRLPDAGKVTVYAWLAVALSERDSAESRRYLDLARALDGAAAERIWSRR